jgi:hypothetical protein
VEELRRCRERIEGAYHQTYGSQLSADERGMYHRLAAIRRWLGRRLSR